jgi:hypothetical protein
MLRGKVAAAVASVLVLAMGGGVAGSAAASDQCTVEHGQLLIEDARYDRAIREFTCVIEDDPTGVEGYRGRIEAELLLGRYSDAVRDYARVTAFVEPVHPDAKALILGGYAARLAADPHDVPALTGASFARWWYFDYTNAMHVLDDLLDVRPNDVYGNLFRGSSRLLQGVTKLKGVADLDRAIELAPKSADVRYVVSDAYTYGLPDPQRAFAEATLALNGGLDTPRIHAILAVAYHAFGNEVAAATETKRHIDLVTTDLRAAPTLAGGSLTLGLVPGRTYEVPLPVVAGQQVSIATSSHDFYDTILVLLAPDGTPVLGADDTKAYFAGFTWVPGATGTYRVRVTSFESVNTGAMVVTRD